MTTKAELETAIAFLRDALATAMLAKDYEINQAGIKEVNFAIIALQEKLSRDYQQPLTLDELKQMVGEPVWVVTHDGTIAPMWEIITEVGECGITMACADTISDYAAFDLYNDTWLAYRSKPGEEHDDD